MTFPRRASSALFVCLCLTPACIKRAPSADIAASVNGRPITRAELDKQIAIQFPQPADKPSDDQLMIQKLEVLRSMVDQEIMLQRAEKLGLMAVDADVDYNEKLGTEASTDAKVAARTTKLVIS